MRGRNQAKPASSARWALLAIVAALVFVAVVRLRFADVPFERDEGEYAYAGQLILEGVPPYQLAYNMKFPGTYYAYAVLLALFGQTPWGIHVGLLLVNGASVLLVYAVGRRLLGDFAGAVAAIAFAILSLDRFVFGVFAHATHFVVLAALAGLLVLLRAIENGRRAWFFWSGVLFGLSVLMKQHAVFFLPLAAGLVVWNGKPRAGRSIAADARTVGILAAGACLPLAVVVTVLFAQGSIERFWFWTFHYARAYVSEIPAAQAFPFFVEALTSVTTANAAFWVLAAFGLVALWSSMWDIRARLCLAGLLAASFAAICPGFFFREHYFIVLLPAVALLTGVALATLRDVLLRSAPRAVATAVAVAVLIAAVGRYVTTQRDYLFSVSSKQLSRGVYGSNPFLESVEIAKYIAERTDANDRIAVLGSEPQIYFYSRRKGATGYVYTYAMMEPQPYARRMQEEMIREIEAAHPRFIVFARDRLSWLPRPDSDQTILTWARDYLQECYVPVGVTDIFSESETRFVWDEANVRSYVAQSQNLVYTFQRKSDAPCGTSEK